MRDDVVTTLWNAGVTPVVSPVAVDEFGDLLNCNADTAAGALAAALGAEALVLLSDVDQLRTQLRRPFHGAGSRYGASRLPRLLASTTRATACGPS